LWAGVCVSTSQHFHYLIHLMPSYPYPASVSVH
jgi:hypothetical protein